MKNHSYFISRFFVHEAFLKDESERSLSEAGAKNERSLSEVLSEVLKPADYHKLEKIIQYIEKNGKITPKEAEGSTNNSVYRANI